MKCKICGSPAVPGSGEVKDTLCYHHYRIFTSWAEYRQSEHTNENLVLWIKDHLEYLLRKRDELGFLKYCAGVNKHGIGCVNFVTDKNSTLCPSCKHREKRGCLGGAAKKDSSRVNKAVRCLI